jgi:hypothetical protein
VVRGVIGDDRRDEGGLEGDLAAGKAVQQEPWLSQSPGSSVCDGRRRPNARLPTSAPTSLTIDASIVCQNVRPTGSSPPSHSAPPISVAMTP